MEEKRVDNQTEHIKNENIPLRPSYGGSLFERRFTVYDKLKIPVKVIDAIIIISVILLFVFFFWGAYIK